MHPSTAAIGIDIGGTNLRAARISQTGEILERLAEKVTTRDAALVLARVGEMARALDRSNVVAIGLGVPGRVDARRRAVLSGGYVDLSSVPLASGVEKATGRPVVIDNDGNMALVAEIAVGAARGRENVVMFTIGTGIGGAIVLEREIVRGRMAAGQLGHITVAVEGERCACGRCGCVETLSSGTALRRLIAEAGLPPQTSADDLLERAAVGDGTAAGLLLRWVRPLRAAIDSVIAAFDPELVLLGGGLGQAARGALTAAPALAPWYQCPVEAAALGDDAGVIGAGLSALIEHRDMADAPLRQRRRAKS